MEQPLSYRMHTSHLPRLGVVKTIVRVAIGTVAIATVVIGTAVMHAVRCVPVGHVWFRPV